jgi:6-pyruvoyltetrahydropterin/6-carboxytetrahydropterin synthase
MFTITQEVHFCYGHRLLHHPGRCRHLHGHSAKAAVTILADELNNQGMVCDFTEIKHVTAGFIDERLDHNLLLHRDDPLCPLLEAANERFLMLDEHPTAEALAKMIYRHVKRQGYRVQKVTVWETLSACASYEESRGAPA